MKTILQDLPEVCANSRTYIDGCAVIDGDWVNAFLADMRAAFKTKGAIFKRKTIAAVLRLVGNMRFGSRAFEIVNTRDIEAIERESNKFSNNENGED